MPTQNKLMRLTCNPCLLLLLAVAILPAKLPAQDQFSEVRPGVFVRQGQQLELLASTVDQIANTGFIVGSKSVAIVDPGGSPDAAKGMLAAISSQTSLPVSHVIVSHSHPDHSFGAWFFEGKALVVGHEKLPNAMAFRLEFYLRRFGDVFEDENLPQAPFVVDLPVEDELAIDLGDRILRIQAHTTAHTDHDLSVYDQTTRTLWASDLLFVERLPALDGSLPGWLEVMDQLESLQADWVIPGHGAASDWASATAPQRQYFDTLLKSVRLSIANGRSLSDVIESDRDNLSQNWTLWDSQSKTNLTKAYTELEWE